MVVFLLVLLICCLFGIKFASGNGFSDYMSPQKSGAIKGIFTVIVLFSHVRKFIDLDKTPLNLPYGKFLSFLGQLMVVMFLFYSGYGIMLGLQKKDGYLKSLITKRTPKVILHFDIAVLCYFISNNILGNRYPIKKLLLAFIGVSDVGNPAWFIFTTVVLYLITFISFVIARKKTIAGTIITTLLTAAAYVALFVWKGKSHWWYDTMLCFPLGMWYALAKPKIDKLLLEDFNKWFFAVSSTGIAFFFLKYVMKNYGLNMYCFVPAALLFALFITFLSMRISVGNKVLNWFGNHIFSMYILQYIPMNIYKHFGLNNYPILFTLCTFATVVLVATVFEILMNKLDVALKLSNKKA